MNLSRLSSLMRMISGSAVTPMVFETLSPKDLLMANPCISSSYGNYSDEAARLASAQLATHFHPYKHALFLQPW